MTRPVTAHLRLLPALALALASCDDAVRHGVPPSDTAEVRILHASPDAPPLDLYAGPSTSRGQLVWNNIAYGNASPFQTVGVGSQALVLTRAGTPYDQLYGIQLDLKKGDKIDLVAAGEADGGLHVVMLHEKGSPPDAGTVRLRFVNASPDATPMGVDLGDDGTIELPDLALFDASSEQGVEIPSARREQLGIVVAGATIERFTVPGLPGGSDTLMVLTGYAQVSVHKSPGISLLAPGLGLLNPDASVYFAYLVRLPNSPSSLDVYVANQLVAADLHFGEMVRIPTTSGNYFRASACSHGETQPRCFTIGQVAYPFSMQGGHSYLVLVHYKVGDFLSTFFDDSFDVHQADAQLRFIDSSVCCSLDVGLVDGGQFTVFEGYSPVGALNGAVSSGPVLSPGTYTLGFRVTGDSTVYGFETPLSPGSRSFAIFVPQTPDLYLVDTASEPWSLTMFSPIP